VGDESRPLMITAARVRWGALASSPASASLISQREVLLQSAGQHLAAAPRADQPFSAHHPGSSFAGQPAHQQHVGPMPCLSLPLSIAFN
jgi:hypothetical protein